MLMYACMYDVHNITILIQITNKNKQQYMSNYYVAFNNNDDMLLVWKPLPETLTICFVCLLL